MTDCPYCLDPDCGFTNQGDGCLTLLGLVFEPEDIYFEAGFRLDRLNKYRLMPGISWTDPS